MTDVMKGRRKHVTALRAKDAQKKERTIRPASIEKVSFTKEMRKDYTILCPQMSPVHFSLLEAAFNANGYHMEVLPNDNKHAVDVGLKYVNNDACYPSLIVVGQIMDALLSGKYDLNKTAVIMTQTGGGCRASNYIAFIRRALKKTGMEQVPVISLNLSGLESNPGFKLTLPLVKAVVYAAGFGDILVIGYDKRPHQRMAKACLMSLYKSSTGSSPTDRRIVCWLISISCRCISVKLP